MRKIEEAVEAFLHSGVRGIIDYSFVREPLTAWAKDLIAEAVVESDQEIEEIQVQHLKEIVDLDERRKKAEAAVAQKDREHPYHAACPKCWARLQAVTARATNAEAGLVAARENLRRSEVENAADRLRLGLDLHRAESALKEACGLLEKMDRTWTGYSAAFEGGHTTHKFQDLVMTVEKIRAFLAAHKEEVKP